MRVFSQVPVNPEMNMLWLTPFLEPTHLNAQVWPADAGLGKALAK